MSSARASSASAYTSAHRSIEPSGAQRTAPASARQRRHRSATRPAPPSATGEGARAASGLGSEELQSGGEQGAAAPSPAAPRDAPVSFKAANADQPPSDGGGGSGGGGGGGAGWESEDDMEPEHPGAGWINDLFLASLVGLIVLQGYKALQVAEAEERERMEAEQQRASQRRFWIVRPPEGPPPSQEEHRARRRKLAVLAAAAGAVVVGITLVALRRRRKQRRSAVESSANKDMRRGVSYVPSDGAPTLYAPPGHLSPADSMGAVLLNERSPFGSAPYSAAGIAPLFSVPPWQHEGAFADAEARAAAEGMPRPRRSIGNGEIARVHDFVAPPRDRSPAPASTPGQHAPSAPSAPSGLYRASTFQYHPATFYGHHPHFAYPYPFVHHYHPQGPNPVYVPPVPLEPRRSIGNGEIHRLAEDPMRREDSIYHRNHHAAPAAAPAPAPAPASEIKAAQAAQEQMYQLLRSTSRSTSVSTPTASLEGSGHQRSGYQAAVLEARAAARAPQASPSTDGPAASATDASAASNKHAAARANGNATPRNGELHPNGQDGVVVHNPANVGKPGDGLPIGESTRDPSDPSAHGGSAFIHMFRSASAERLGHSADDSRGGEAGPLPRFADAGLVETESSTSGKPAMAGGSGDGRIQRVRGGDGSAEPAAADLGLVHMAAGISSEEANILHAPRSPTFSPEGV